MEISGNPEDDRRTKQVIVMRKDLNMRKGKMVAQGAHASVSWLLNRLVVDGHYSMSGEFSEQEWAWIHGRFTKVCVGVDSEVELLRVFADAHAAGLNAVLITDAGLTEFAGTPTNTCVAIGPDWNESVDAATGDLRLL